MAVVSSFWNIPTTRISKISIASTGIELNEVKLGKYQFVFNLFFCGFKLVEACAALYFRYNDKENIFKIANDFNMSMYIFSMPIILGLKHKSFCHLIHQLREGLSKDYSLPLSNEQLEAVTKAQKRVNFVETMYITSCVFGVVGTFISPFIFGLLNVYRGTQSQLSIPLFNWFPYDMCEPIYYYITCVPVLCFYWITITHHLAWQCTLFTSVLFVQGEINVLALSILQLDERTNNMSLLKRRNKSKEAHLASKQDQVWAIKLRQKCLSACLKESNAHHQKIIACTVELNNALRWIIFAYNQCVSFLLCFAIMQVAQAPRIVSVAAAPYLCMAMTVLLQLGLSCFFGQIVQNESETVRLSLYNCTWEDKPEVFKRCLRIMMTRATKPLVLSAGLYTVNMEAFGRIFKYGVGFLSCVGLSGLAVSNKKRTLHNTVAQLISYNFIFLFLLLVDGFEAWLPSLSSRNL